jgi:hypothetical protein
MSRSVAVLMILLFGGGNCIADDSWDRVKLSAGVFDIFRYDSTISLTETNSGLGVSFTPQDTLGWSAEQTLTRLDGLLRVNEAHALNLTWYSLSTSGNRSIQEELDWVDINGNATVIPIGAGVSSRLGFDTYKLSYFWSFYHSEKVELSVGAGLHMTDVAVELAAEITSTGVAASDADTTLPLPVVGFRMNYNVTPKFSWYVRSEIFSIEFDEWEGTYSTAQLGMEYRAFEHVGFGLGVASDAFIVTEETKHHRFQFKNRLTGLHAFVSAYF